MEGGSLDARCRLHEVQAASGNVGAARSPAQGSLKVARLSPRLPGPGIRVHAAQRVTVALGHLPGYSQPCRCHRGAVGPWPLPSLRPGARSTSDLPAGGAGAAGAVPGPVLLLRVVLGPAPAARGSRSRGCGVGVGGYPGDRGRSGAPSARVTGRGRAGEGAEWAPERRAGARPGTGPGPGTVSRAPQRGLSPWLRAAGPRASPRAAVTVRRAPGPPRPAPPPPPSPSRPPRLHRHLRD